MAKGRIKIASPPRGLAIFALLGPGLVWCSEMVGSGEVILTTRVGAILGAGVLWAIVIGIFLKYWIGVGGAHYTTCTGEGMIDMFDRIPGPRHWVVWIVLVVQFVSAAIAIGSIALAAGAFVNALLPISPYFGGWVVSLFALVIVWSGGFQLLRVVMSLFVFIMIIGVLWVAVTLFPGVEAIAQGFLLRVPSVPHWAVVNVGVSPHPWHEILPLMGWAAGGFASQVWYTYWVLSAGYGAAQGREPGRPADVERLRGLSRSDAEKIRGWCRVVYTDAALAMGITLMLTIGFLIAGAVVLGPRQLAPAGPQVAITLSTIFSSQWGRPGAILFLVAGAVALIGTQTVQLAGWPRLLADSFRICLPRLFAGLGWKTQFRSFLLLFFSTNMIIVFTLGVKPVFLVKIAAVADGLLLTPLQALWLLVGLYWILPKVISRDAAPLLRPHWILALGLIAAFLFFGCFCAFQIPFALGLR